MKSRDYIKYLRKKKVYSIFVLITRIFILLLVIFLWEMGARLNLINSFITSSPSRIIKTIYNLYLNNNLFNNIFITFIETIIAFLLSLIIGFIAAIIMWYSKFFYDVSDPYLTIFNSLPKVSLGPILIIWVGANMKSIIVMAILVSVIIMIVNTYNAFSNTDKNMIKLLKSMRANKFTILRELVIPSSYTSIISTLKINISMALIGVIMGELLVSKSGIGYLIMFGSQVFNLDLVMAGILLLLILSWFMYIIVCCAEKKLIKDAIKNN